MLLVLDVGNTNTVIGLYEGDALVECWRIQTNSGRTSDEWGIQLRALLEHRGHRPDAVAAVIVSCVVPSALYSLESMAHRAFGVTAEVVGPGLKTGMRILYDNPREVGADRVVNAVAAYERYGGPTVVVDFGTATTLDCITADGAYLGGLIAPGFGISADALFRSASKLPRVEPRRPARVVGRNTIESIQAGLYYGYVDLVDGLVRRVQAELQTDARVVATGGLAALIAESSATIQNVDDDLTLYGLLLIHQRNRSG